MRGSVLSTLLLLFASSLHGQTPLLEPGTILRVRTYGHEVSGLFVRWDTDTLVARPDRGANPGADRATAASEILELDRSVPRSHGRGAARGALWGLVIGGVVGLAAGAAQETDCFLCPDSHTEGALIGGAVLGGLGAGVGALVGVIVPGQRWEPVPLGRADAAPTP